MGLQRRWGESWHEKLEFLEGLQDEGKNVPSLDDRPELDPALMGYWEAFHVLSPSRAMGMTVGYIPLEEMRAYMDIFSVEDSVERERLVLYIQALDRVFVEHAHEPGDKKGTTPEDTMRERRRGRRR